MMRQSTSRLICFYFLSGRSAICQRAGSPRRLDQVGQILRPGSGRAYVSIYDGSLLKKKENIAFHQPEGTAEIQSVFYPNISYRESNHGETLEGNVMYVTYELEADCYEKEPDIDRSLRGVSSSHFSGGNSHRRGNIIPTVSL